MAIRVAVLNGNAKKNGFIADVLSVISSHLTANGVSVKNISLYESHIKDCIGCFTCLKTGVCIIEDDMRGIIEAMKGAHGFVVGSPVRNGLVTACYKRFLERITYILGFTLLLEDKYTLAISSVGYAGGKKINRDFLGLQNVFHTRLSGFLFYKVGIPTKIKASDINKDLEKASDKLIMDIKNRSPRSLMDRVAFAIERRFMRKLMFEKYPEVYANVIKSWKEKGYYT